MDSEPPRLHDSEILLRTAQKLCALASVDERVDCIVKSLQECLAWDRAWLGLVDMEAGVLRGMAWFGENLPREVVMKEIPLDASIRNPALLTVFEKGPVVVDDPQNDPRCRDARDSLAALGTKAFVNVPILVRDGVIGVIGVDRTKEPARLSAEDVELIAAFANLAGLAIENARLHDGARELSLTNGLTGLHNIRFLREQMARELSRSERSAQHFSVLMIDIDNLKCVNDHFGHQAGDELLEAMAQAIRGVIRPSDVVARYGGDEFVVLLPGASREVAYIVAGRIAQSIASLAPIHGEVQATVSIGIASYPEDGLTRDALLRVADEAMFRAKRAGGNRVFGSQTGEMDNAAPRD